MLWWRQINSFMFINTTLEKTILFTLFTELLIKDLWTGGPQDRDCGSGRERERDRNKRADEGGQSHRARSKSSLMFRMEGAQTFREGMKCVCVRESSTTGKLGVKQRFSALTHFLLNKLPCPFANQSKTNIAFHSLHLFEWTYRHSQNTHSQLRCN